MRSDQEDEVRSFIREHHVHFDLGTRVEIVNGERARVGEELRLWAVHSRRSGALPGCERCRELFRALERIALGVTSGDPVALGAIQPFRPALYDSRVVPDSDEIALEIRSPSNGAGATSGTATAWSKRMRDALRALGVPER